MKARPAFNLAAAIRTSAELRKRQQQAERRNSCRVSKEINNNILRPPTVPAPPAPPSPPDPPPLPLKRRADAVLQEEGGFRRWKHAKQVRSAGVRSKNQGSVGGEAVPSIPKPLPWFEAPKPRSFPIDGPVPTDIDPPGIVLMQHQRAVVQAVVGLRGMLLAHRMGAGKTVTSLAAGSLLLRMGKVDRIVVLAPVSVQQYWRDTAVRVLGPSCFDGGKFKVFTHAGVVKLTAEAVSTALLVVDEAHTFRTPIRVDRGKTAKEFLRASAAAARLLLLTGTPVVNHEHDLRNLAAALDGVSWRAVAHMYRTSTALYEAFRGSVSLFGSVASDSDTELARRLGLPDCKFHRENRFVMDREYNEEYERVINNDVRALLGDVEEEEEEEEGDPAVEKKKTKDLSAFYNGERRATNRTSQRDGSMKLEWLYSKAPGWRDLGQRFAVFSSWKRFGAELVQQQLAQRGVVAGIITGDVRSGMRAQLVAAFNEGRMHGLVLTGAGSEGLDLRGVEHVVPLEPCWNWAKAAQAVGRAVRIGSHDHLPPERRVVNVYQVVLRRQERSDEEIARIENDGDVSQDELAAMRLSADEKLMRFTNEKRALMLKAEAELRERSV